MNYPVIFALLTAFCWGTYGPVLQEARAELTSPFKPYLMIGLAYLVWGVVGGIIGMSYKGDSFSFSGAGTVWGFAAGTLGAWGAFTLTLAMFSGGKPFIVMPIVFGGAVTISAITQIAVLSMRDPSHLHVSPMLWVGVVGILICTSIVAYFTPHAPPPKKPGATPPAATVPAEPAHK